MTLDFVVFEELTYDEMLSTDGGSFKDWLHMKWDQFCTRMGWK